MKIKFVLLFFAVVILLGIGFYWVTHITTSTGDTDIMSVNVTPSTITIGATFEESYLCYAGYRVRYEDGFLYVKILRSLIESSCTMDAAPFTIIPNTYGPIKAIYLQGSSPSDQKLIWSAPEPPTQ